VNLPDDQRRAAFQARMSDFYSRVDAQIALRRPVCVNRGACCKFGAYGHRLFVTEVELACFAMGQAGSTRRPEGMDACPYQVDGFCSARSHRPLGCRIFFCDPAAQHWQSEEYERGLLELKQIGEEFGIEYRYQEWLAALDRVAGEAAVGKGCASVD